MSGTRRLVFLLVLLAAPSGAASLELGADAAPTALAETLARAQDGDTIVVSGGHHRGPFTLEHSVELLGRGWPTLDGMGAGTVVTIRAPRSRLEGFLIRGSGTALDRESSGVVLDAPDGQIVGNRFEEVLFGVFLREASGSVVAGNQIRGMALDVARRGDGIRVWESDRVVLRGNRVEGGRDVVLWYSHDLTIEDNQVRGGRYGLHFMYCDDARVVRNLLFDNSVGVFLMYSRRLHLEANTIAGNHGPSGQGVGLKDMDDVVLKGNVFAGNRVGVFLDNSPQDPSRRAELSGNLFAGNDLAIELFPNVRRAEISGNDFVDNEQAVAIAGGGGEPAANLWQGNYWSDYLGYDEDGDGVGETAMRGEQLFEDLADRRPELRLLASSLASEAIGFAARAFPLVKPRTRFTDPAPRLTPKTHTGTPPLPRHVRRPLAPLGGGLLAGALLLLLAPRLRTGTAPHRPTPDTPPLIEVEALTRRFGARAALDGVSFTIRAGESVALWGPNGAGKTTTLRALLGVIPVDGRVRIGGFDPQRDGKAARRLLGFVPQEVQLAGDWGVAETLEFYARLRGAGLRGPVDERIARLLDELGLTAEVGKKVGELSGGLRQRLALALALISDPPILLLDEPTANLDARARRHFLELLTRLKGRGKTLIFSSHRSEEVRTLADRVLRLEDGRRVADTPAAQADLEPPEGDDHAS